MIPRIVLLIIFLVLANIRIGSCHQQQYSSIKNRKANLSTMRRPFQVERGGGSSTPPRIAANQESMQLQQQHANNRKNCRDRRGNAFTIDQKEARFEGVVFVAFLNILLNTMRPDEDISWQMRFPRFCWELSVALVASCTNHQKRTAPAVYLLLSLMTGSTALVDVFVWAPIFAYTASFETCTGGGLFSRQPKVCYPDYAKGFGRLIVSGQSLFTGLYYLMTAIMAWGAYTSVRDQQKVERHIQAIQLASQHTASFVDANELSTRPQENNY
mmetsp:Transcript_4871/g.5841  ORF Transcript_4871/g.5841 Transcript_4871/m.5841 type:complete len:271 (-) Transcript_4871:819-1631(-)